MPRLATGRENEKWLGLTSQELRPTWGGGEIGRRGANGWIPPCPKIFLVRAFVQAFRDAPCEGLCEDLDQEEANQNETCLCL